MPITDITFVISWWIILLVFGVASIPIAALLFPKFADKGYGLTKTLGVVCVSFIVFVLSVLKIAPFTQGSILLVLFTYACLNAYIYSKNQKKIRRGYSKASKLIVAEEILFIFGLVFWSYVRAHQPDINGLEKFMDLGFVNSLMRTEYLPPEDMWFAGKSINYYWFGHYVTALLTKVSSIPTTITYNLMLATILGFVLSSSFSIISTLTRLSQKKIPVRVLFASGVISATLVAFAGNFHTPVYYYLDGVDNYWYPDATRFIGYNPDVDDKTIHEFPLYSFVVSDLHGHLINLPFVLLYIALLASFFVKEKDSPWDAKKLIPLGFVLGVMFMTSTWDFGNYSLATLVTFGLYFLARSKLKLRDVILIGISGLLVLGIALVTASLFIHNFESIAQGIDFVSARSRLWQLAILWGFPATMSLIFLTTIAIKHKRDKKLSLPDFFVGGLLITSWILIVLPEVIYVKDIYVATHHRANTMFKLTYQAFVMSYLTSGYIAARTFMVLNKKMVKTTALFVFLGLFGLVLIYPPKAIKSYYGELKTYKGLAGDVWMERQYPDEYKLYKWMDKNIQGQPTILEAPGDSYTNYNMISSYTGIPTVNGWFVHEWLWRGDSKYPSDRNIDIEQIYTGIDIQEKRNLIDEYNIQYILVGTHEGEKYPSLDERDLMEIGDIVFESGRVRLYKLKPESAFH